MHLFDSHAHLSSEDMLHEIDGVLDRAKNSLVKKVVNIATDLVSLEEGVKLHEKYPWVFLAGATPPHDVEEKGEEELAFFETRAKQKKLVAIGETGLDYYYKHSREKKQQEFLLRYVDLAKRENLPLIFHCRQAFKDLFSLTRKEDISAVIHCFTGTWQEAKEALERGWFLSFSGIVTFTKSKELREVVKKVPLKNLLIETDSPYLAPQPMRGKKNEPSFLIETAKVLAEIKQVSLEEMAKITYKNAKSFFQLP